MSERPAFESAVSVAIEQHVSQHLGKEGQVYHELISDIVPIDLHILPPRPERNFFTIVTSGMSYLPMLAPPDRRDCSYSELLLCLPPTWLVLTGEYQEERYWWPFRLLKSLARFPHEYNRWLWSGHTVPNGDPPAPYADNTRFCCALIGRPILFEEGFESLQLADRTIEFNTVLPLYREEMELKISQGLDSLFDHFEANCPEISELLTLDRPNAVVSVE